MRTVTNDKITTTVPGEPLAVIVWRSRAFLGEQVSVAYPRSVAEGYLRELRHVFPHQRRYLREVSA